MLFPCKDCDEDVWLIVNYYFAFSLFSYQAENEIKTR